MVPQAPVVNHFFPFQAVLLKARAGARLCSIACLLGLAMQYALVSERGDERSNVCASFLSVSMLSEHAT